MCFKQIKYGTVRPIADMMQKHYLDCSVDKSLKFVEEAYKSWADAYSSKADTLNEYPLEYYCGNYFRNINGCLRGYYEDMGLLASHNEDLRIKELKNIILNAPRTPSGVIVYRGVYNYFAEQLIANNKSSCPTVESGFMSTTLLFDRFQNLEEFACYKHILKIFVNKGTPAIYMDQIKTRYMLGREERELLFLPGASLVMVRYPYRKKHKIIYECAML